MFRFFSARWNFKRTHFFLMICSFFSLETKNIDIKIESYQTQDVIYEGKKSTQIIYIDERTNRIIGTAIVPHDGSVAMLTPYLQPVTTPNKNLESLQKLAVQHNAFNHQALMQAHKLDSKVHIQKIANAYALGHISAEQAYQEEMKIHCTKQLCNDLKAIQAEIKQKVTRAKLEKKLAKAGDPSFVTKIINYLGCKSPVKGSNNRSKKLHINKKSMQSIAQQAQPVKKTDLEKLQHQYEPIAQMYEQAKKSDAQTDAEQSNQFAYAARIATRLQALAQSNEQLLSKKLVYQEYQLSSQARGFMMAHNINYAAFDGANATKFQHCLTQELLGIVEQSASLGLNNDSYSMIGQFARYNCDLAVTAQQLNQTSRIEQAVAVTDLSHFFALYGQSMIADDGAGDAQAFYAVGKGAVQAILKWHEFAKKIGHQETRSQTMSEIIDNCKTIGKTMYNIAAAAYEFSPHAYAQDLYDGMKNYVDQQLAGKNPEAVDPADLVSQRVDRNLQTLKNCYVQSLQTAQIVVQEMMKKSAQENIANVTEIVVDGWITDKVTHLLGKLSQTVGDQVLQAAHQLVEEIPSHLHNSSFHQVQTSAGAFDLLADATGESISAASAAQIAANNLEKIASNLAKAKELSKKIDELTKPDRAKVEAFEKSIEPYLNSEKIINVERLQSIEGVEQIQKFKDYTNNFTDLAKLKPEEILYLNLCDWLEPQARTINARLKEIGGIKIIDQVTKAETIIEKYDLFHSLLGEMSPNALANRVKGGHLCITQLKASIFDIGEIKQFGQGFFDMGIEYAGKGAGKYKPNSFFPLGTSVEQGVEMIEQAIIYPKEITIKTNPSNIEQKVCELTSKLGDKFMIRIENKTAQFHPWNA